MGRQGYKPEQIIAKLREAEILLNNGHTIHLARFNGRSRSVSNLSTNPSEPIRLSSGLFEKIREALP